MLKFLSKRKRSRKALLWGFILLLALGLIGVFTPGLGGLGGGYLAARLLDPLHPERGNHVIAAALCLALSLAAVVASVVKDLPVAR